MLKKLLKINLFIFCICLLFWCSILIDYIKSNKHKSIDFYSYNDFYYVNKDIDYIDEFIIPVCVEGYMRKNNWKVYFSTLEIEPLFGEKKTFLSDGLGVTILNKNEVYVEAKDSKDQSIKTFYHELGHVFDKSLGYPSTSNVSFLKLYDTYKESYIYPYKSSFFFRNTYVNSSSQEFFAGLFEAMMLYPEYLINNYPDIYSYMYNLIY